MKRALALIFTVCLVFLSVSCDRSASEDKKVSGSPPDYVQVFFDTYEEMEKALADGLTPIYDPAAYKNMADMFKSGELKPSVPQMNGKNIPLDNREEDNITLFSKMDYNLPWFFYDCLVDGKFLQVRISYLAPIKDERLDSVNTFNEAISILDPDFPTPDNYDKSDFKQLYKKTIILANSKTVEALICEYEGDNPRIHVRMLYDDILVTLYADPEVLTDEFYSSFSMS